MTTFQTFLLEPGDVWSMVPYQNFDGTIPDPYMVDGALKITGRKDAIIEIETENIDILWASIIDAILKLINGASETKALVPDYPEEVIFRTTGKNSIECSCDGTTLRDNKRDFAISVANEAWPFYEKMCDLLPMNSSSYRVQELTELREIFEKLGTTPPG